MISQCTYVKEVTISIEHKPSLHIENDKIVINKFWKLNPKNKESEFLTEFNKLFLEIMTDNFFENEVVQEKINDLVPIREENKNNDFNIEEVDWKKLRDKLNVRYIVYGGVDFKIEDASGYVYKRVYNSQYHSYNYENVYQKKIMYNFALKIILFDLEKQEEIFNKKYSSSITRDGKDTSAMTEFENMTLDILDEFLNNFKPSYEKQTRSLIGM
jgi:hypothetical protein